MTETLTPLRTSNYRLWVNEARTVLVHLWDSGVVEVATREAPDHTWGPPITCDEDKFWLASSARTKEEG